MSDDMISTIAEQADALAALSQQLSEALAERDAAREHAVLARLREKTAEDARIHAVDTAEALQVITEQQADSIAKLERDVQRWQEAHVLAVKQREEANACCDEEAERAEAAEAKLATTRCALEAAMGHFGDDMADVFIDFVQSREASALSARDAPQQVQAVVKALEWVLLPDRSPDFPRWEAVALDETYIVFKAWWGKHDKWGFVFSDRGFHHTEDEAKAAAQDKFERRILSALTRPQITEAKPLDALVAACCRFRRRSQ